MKKIYIYAGIGGWIFIISIIAISIGLGSQNDTGEELTESNKIYNMNEMLIHPMTDDRQITVTVTKATRVIDSKSPQICLLGDCYDDRKAGKEVVNVFMEITNLGNDEYLDSPYQFEIQDENGKRYGPTSRQFGLSTNIKEISKGESYETKIQYDVNTPAENLELIIKPYWGGKESVVQLDQVTKLRANLCQGTEVCFGGFVTKIVDGDTLDIIDIETRQEKRIRLALIDTPEKDEPLFETASDFTAGFCAVDSYVLFDEDDGQTGGSFGRIIGKVFCEGILLNEKLLENDLAQIDTRFCGVSEYGQETWATKYGC